MKRWALLVTFLAVLDCSDLTEGAGGVVALEIQQPTTTTIEVGQTLLLTAVALDKDGNVVPATISWRAPDPTLTVDPNGLITGVSPGPGRVQAFVGSLSSGLLAFTVTPVPAPPPGVHSLAQMVQPRPQS